MSDQIHALEQREIMIHTAAVRAAIYAARGLPYDLWHATPIPPPVIDYQPAERLGALIDNPDDTGSSAHD